MKQKDIFLSILKNSVPSRYVAGFSRNILRPNNTFGYAPAGTPPAHVQLVGIRPTMIEERSDHAPLLFVPVILATYDLWAFVSENHEELVDGLLNTLKVSAFGIAGAFLIGAVLGAARAHRIPVVSQITAVYVEVIRNTPILVQIFMIFYALPQFGILLNQFTVAWLSVMIWGGAFNTENFRAGFEAVPFRFREAASAGWLRSST